MILLDKKAIVTGGSRGIGRAIVKELAKNGCNVVFTDIAFPSGSPEEEAKIILNEIGNPNIKLYGFTANAASSEDAKATVEFTERNLGGLDILVNNAGITKDGLLLRMSDEDFSKVIDINLKGVFFYTKAALKPMMSQRYGKIINIASVVGIIGNPGQANYVASKAGVIGMTKSNAKELASRNITVNAIAPGFIQTDMTEKLTEEQKQALLSVVPLKRMGKPEDIAKVVKFLSSEDSDYITGQVLVVDGGMVM